MIHAQPPTKALAWKMIGAFCTEGRTPSLEIMSHFSSLCLGVDKFYTAYCKRPLQLKLGLAPVAIFTSYSPSIGQTTTSKVNEKDINSS